MKELRDFLNSPPGPKEPPKGSFYDVKRSRNARKHGLYSKHLLPEQLQQFGDTLEVRDLAPDIAILPVKLNSLLNGPGASPDLIIKTLQVLGSLMTFNAAAFTENHVSNTIRFPVFLQRIPRLIQSILGTNWHPFVFQVESLPPLESQKRIPHNPIHS